MGQSRQAGQAARGGDQVWAAQRVALPRCWRWPVPQPPLAGPHLDGRDRGCGAAAACTPLLRPDWLQPRGEAARVASGPDCRPKAQGRRLALAPHSSSPAQSCCRPAVPSPLLPCCLLTTPTHTRRIGWHDANQLRRLDARGDRAIPDGGPAHCYRTSHQAPALPITGWLSSPVPSVTRNLPMQVGEKEVRFQSVLRLILPLAAALSLILTFLFLLFTFSNSKIPIIT